MVEIGRGHLFSGTLYNREPMNFFTTIMRPLPLLLAMFLNAPAAHADWQYTHWGTTPEQVVAASRGAAQVVPEKNRPKGLPLLTAATGTYQEGSLELRVTFQFKTASNGLACVSYGVNSHDQDDAFKAALVKRYGPPQKTSGGGFLGTTLSWTTATDQIDATFSNSDPAFAMQCSVKR
jgi:hypothetical protein